MFLTSEILFLQFFPAPYLQYFVPLSVFVSILAAVALSRIARIFPLAMWQLVAFTVAMGAIAGSFTIQYHLRVGRRADNREQLTVIDTLLTITKSTETVYDMVGSYVFRPDGYYICCHPYAEFVDKLATKPLPLPASLVANATKFIVLDQTGLVFWKPLPDDLTFLLKHYVESPYNKIYVLGAKFLCAHGSCSQVDLASRPVVAAPNSFDIIIPERYRIDTIPPNEPVRVDGTTLGNGLHAFVPGLYRFSVPMSVSSLRIRLAR